MRIREYLLPDSPLGTSDTQNDITTSSSPFRINYVAHSNISRVGVGDLMIKTSELDFLRAAEKDTHEPNKVVF